MKISSVLAVASFIFFGAATLQAEELAVGKPAPDFSLMDASGTKHSLSDYKGKVVVLEWFNPDCPFVKKHYGPGSMQKSQATVVADGAVWLSINSSAEGKQGHLSPELAKETIAELGMKSTSVLLDPDGTVGKKYGAKTTPHMFVVGADGMLAYQGAIDDKASTNESDVFGAKNFVLAAVTALKADAPVSPNTTEPYGCGVKYKVG
jgi:peroxiredoxin